MSSSTAEHPIEISDSHPKLELAVYQNGMQVWQAKLPDVLEIGRQDMTAPEVEPPAHAIIHDDRGFSRLIVANSSERRVSRHHVRILLIDGQLVITNLSKIQPIRCNDVVLRPLEERTQVADAPINIELHNRLLVIRPADSSGSIFSLERKTRSPGSKPLPGRFQGDSVDLSHLEEAPEFMMWLSETIEVLQSAVNSPDFLRLACQAVVDIVKLEHAQVLILDDGVWRLEAFHSAQMRDELPTPSGQIMRQMVSERKTFWMLPLADAQDSLRGVNAVIAAPILDADGSVIGAIYGDQRATGGQTGITDLEAKMVEVLAYAVASGLLTRKHQEHATLARIESAKLEQFFSPKLATLLLEQPDLLQGRDVEVTVLFCDVKNFTGVSDNVPPGDLLQWLNAVQDMLSDCVIQTNGVLVDYVGDALLAMWGAPLHQPDHATLACRAAVAMSQQLPFLDIAWKDKVFCETQVGIGISTGMAIVGNTGSKRKFKYGPLGRTVNLGSRVQAATRTLQTPIIVTESTVLRLAQDFAFRRIGKIRLHNLQGAENLFEMHPAPDDEWRDLRAAYEGALDAFEAGGYEEALRHLTALLKRWPEDGPAQGLQGLVRQALDNNDEFDDVWSLPK